MENKALTTAIIAKGHYTALDLECWNNEDLKELASAYGISTDQIEEGLTGMDSEYTWNVTKGTAKLTTIYGRTTRWMKVKETSFGYYVTVDGQREYLHIWDMGVYLDHRKALRNR